jgi:hypothetical protein
MLAWGIAPGVRLLIHQTLKARPNPARVTGPNIIPVEINEVTPGALPQVRHGESVLWRTGGECCAFGAKHIPRRGGSLATGATGKSPFVDVLAGRLIRQRLIRELSAPSLRRLS